MGDVKHLSSLDAIEKLQELATEETCLFGTFTGEFALRSRPMSTQKIEDDGSFWFFSGKDSHKNREIAQNDKVELLYANSSKENYLAVHGKAEITTDRAKIEELWTPLIKTWFQEGKDDPNLSLIKVTPQDAYYWDTKHGKMVAFAKMLTSVVVGKTMDDGIEGSLNV
ncbi:general stress protein [Segetibacter sp. 3557_3]|uniref:pyridoxamine 5'-phosphate oxidase family protein n=1 Tax=Segetibacter sp. 3557_3 TaxID=2547429 RepID=UPI001058FED4|nr:pyridoxamine 5'-phosphate oxidase family protein [Segetibacter sp. 3557_3]TDH20030.1 general stress protein [Segetibacter sp. 3557_3]